MTSTTQQYSDMTDTTLAALALSLRASMHENGSLFRKFEYLRENAGLNGVNPFYARYNAACARWKTVIDAMTERSLCIPDAAK